MVTRILETRVSLAGMDGDQIWDAQKIADDKDIAQDNKIDSYLG